MTAGNPIGVQSTVRQLVRLVARACEFSGEDLHALDEQLQRAAVTNNKPTMVDVEIPHDAPKLAVPDGPLPIRAYVVSQLGEVSGEILVWIKSGVLQGVEQAWYTDEPPSEWPAPDLVQLR